MKRIYKILTLLLAVSFAACTDLDVPPQNRESGDDVFDNLESYEAFIAKVYSSIALTGQDGPTGDADIKSIDEGTSSYLRLYWKLQELPTEEAVVAWADDQTILSFNTQTWGVDDPFVLAMYTKIFFVVSQANEFIRESAEGVLDERGFSDEDKAVIRLYKAEARYIRALAYYHAMDLFGNVSFYTEESTVGAEPPGQATSTEVFEYIESELAEIESELFEPKSGPYGRVDQAAVWALQAKMYLNAEAYTSTDRYSDCITACNKIIESGAYSLTDNYQANFMADNHLSSEIIFAALFDGNFTQTYGGTTFLVHASIGGNMVDSLYGVTGAWGGIRTTENMVDLFPDVTGDVDSRAIFFTDGQTKEITNMATFQEGFAVPKYTNITSTGGTGSHNEFVDTDFPFFRLGDVYLMYAESVLRNGGGDRATALGYINLLRERAYGSDQGNITDAELTLSFILDERGRELYWEAQRRADLIRFGQFSDNRIAEFADRGIWPWKGGTEEGQYTSAHRDLYPIPSSELIANPNLEQNDGY